ncbi:DUF2341 domain-containing protein, partial [bacterium]|nr:DUF2341 domain-containing protein [bacterium]
MNTFKGIANIFYRSILVGMILFLSFPVLNVTAATPIVEPVRDGVTQRMASGEPSAELVSQIMGDTTFTKVDSNTTNKKITVQVNVGDWQNAREITVDNTGNSDKLTDYQVLVQFDTETLIAEGKMNADGSDIRFAPSDFSSWLDYWIEGGIQDEFGMDEPDTKVWVKIPFIPALSTTTIYMLFGNPSAVAMSSIGSTFIFGDDFNDNSLDASLWNTSLVAQGNIQEQNQRLEHLSPKSDPQSRSDLESTSYFTEPVVVEMRFKKGGYVYR